MKKGWVLLLRIIRRVINEVIGKEEKKGITLVMKESKYTDEGEDWTKKVYPNLTKKKK